MLTGVNYGRQIRISASRLLKSEPNNPLVLYARRVAKADADKDRTAQEIAGEMTPEANTQFEDRVFSVLCLLLWSQGGLPLADEEAGLVQEDTLRVRLNRAESDALKARAAAAGQTVGEYVRRQLFPQAPGYRGIRGETRGGGKVTITVHVPDVGGAVDGLSTAEYNAYKRAKAAAHPANGGNWKLAREILEKAGFVVSAL